MKSSVLSLLFLLLFLAPRGSALAQGQAPDGRAIQPPVSVQHGPASSSGAALPYRADRLLIKLTPAAARSVGFTDSRVAGRLATGIATLDALNLQTGAQSMALTHAGPAHPNRAAQIGIDRWYTLEIPAGSDVEALAARYRNNPNVEAATPDYRAFPAVAPNDPMYPSQWGHNNTGQMLSYDWSTFSHENGSPVGTPGFDSNAEAAWGTATATAIRAFSSPSSTPAPIWATRTFAW